MSTRPTVALGYEFFLHAPLAPNLNPKGALKRSIRATELTAQRAKPDLIATIRRIDYEKMAH